jgi:Flp pilus assembly protein TadG
MIASVHKIMVAKRGSTVVEAALLAPFLFVLVMGVTDFVQASALKLRLQRAAQSGAMFAARDGGEDAVGIRSRAATEAGVPVEQVAIAFTRTCDKVRVQDSQACASEQAEGRVVEVRVSGSYLPRFNYGPLGESLSGKQTEQPVAMTAAATVRIG